MIENRVPRGDQLAIKLLPEPQDYTREYSSIPNAGLRKFLMDFDAHLDDIQIKDSIHTFDAQSMLADEMLVPSRQIYRLYRYVRNSKILDDTLSRAKEKRTGDNYAFSRDGFRGFGALAYMVKVQLRELASSDALIDHEHILDETKKALGSYYLASVFKVSGDNKTNSSPARPFNKKPEVKQGPTTRKDLVENVWAKDYSRVADPDMREYLQQVEEEFISSLKPEMRYWTLDQNAQFRQITQLKPEDVTTFLSEVRSGEVICVFQMNNGVRQNDTHSRALEVYIEKDNVRALVALARIAGPYFARGVDVPWEDVVVTTRKLLGQHDLTSLVRIPNPNLIRDERIGGGADYEKTYEKLFWSSQKNEAQIWGINYTSGGTERLYGLDQNKLQELLALLPPTSADTFSIQKMNKILLRHPNLPEFDVDMLDAILYMRASFRYKAEEFKSKFVANSSSATYGIVASGINIILEVMKKTKIENAGSVFDIVRRRDRGAVRKNNP